MVLIIDAYNTSLFNLASKETYNLNSVYDEDHFFIILIVDAYSKS